MKIRPWLPGLAHLYNRLRWQVFLTIPVLEGAGEGDTPGPNEVVASLVEISLKYAHVERERRFLVSGVPAEVTSTRRIVDRYITGTRLRLREVHDDGVVTRKLTQKIRLSSGPVEVACTNFYLDDAEWELLSELPATVLHKMRHIGKLAERRQRLS